MRLLTVIFGLVLSGTGASLSLNARADVCLPALQKLTKIAGADPAILREVHLPVCTGTAQNVVLAGDRHLRVHCEAGNSDHYSFTVETTDLSSNSSDQSSYSTAGRAAHSYNVFQMDGCELIHQSFKRGPSEESAVSSSEVDIPVCRKYLVDPVARAAGQNENNSMASAMKDFIHALSLNGEKLYLNFVALSDKRKTGRGELRKSFHDSDEANVGKAEDCERLAAVLNPPPSPTAPVKCGIFDKPVQYSLRKSMPFINTTDGKNRVNCEAIEESKGSSSRCLVCLVPGAESKKATGKFGVPAGTTFTLSEKPDPNPNVLSAVASNVTGYSQYDDSTMNLGFQVTCEGEAVHDCSRIQRLLDFNLTRPGAGSKPKANQTSEVR